MSALVPTYKLSIGSGKKTAKVKAKQATLKQLEKALTTHNRRAVKDGPYIVPAVFTNNHRSEANHKGSFAITLDYDSTELSAIECLQRISGALPCTTFVIYSTFQHCSENVRLRLVIVLSRLVSADEYRQLADIVAAKIGIPIDPCSVCPVQAMYLPAALPGSDVFSHVEPGNLLDVDAIDLSSITPVCSVDDFDDDLDSYPLNDCERIQLQAILDAYPAQGLDWHQWWYLTVIVYHMFRGSPDARNMCTTWSAKSDKHDSRDISRRWPTYKRKSHEKKLGRTRLKKLIVERGGPHSVCMDNLLSIARGISHD